MIDQLSINRILVIEDNPGDFLLISDYLEDFLPEKELVQADSFEKAKNLLAESEQQFTVILLDLSLPDHQGQDLIHDTLALANNVPVIVLTGYSNMQFSVKSLSLGIADYLLKDELNPTTLYKSILYSIERKSIQNDLLESEKKYKQLFELNPSPMFIMDVRSRKMLNCNSMALKKYGYEAKEFLSLRLDDLEANDEYNLNIGESQKNNKTAVHKTKKGELIFVEYETMMLNFQNEIASMVLVNDVTERIRLQEKILEQVIKGQEKERNRLAREIHDSITQQLVACMLYAQNLQNADWKNQKKIEEISSNLYTMIKKATDELRDITHNLRSAEIVDSNLSQLFKNLIFQLNQITSITFELKDYLDPEDLKKIDENTRTHCYRIFQELCNNIIKHSDADQVKVTLEASGKKLFITVNDNGKGITSPEKIWESGGAGIENIKNRMLIMGGKIFMNKGMLGGLQSSMEVPLGV